MGKNEKDPEERKKEIGKGKRHGEKREGGGGVRGLIRTQEGRERTAPYAPLWVYVFVLGLP